MLRKIQEEHKEWLEQNFGYEKPWQALLGVVEEVGELAHSHLKEDQGIRVDEDHLEKIKDAIGDIVIYLISYCNRRDLDFQDIVVETWDIVKKRNWKENPKDGKV